MATQTISPERRRERKRNQAKPDAIKLGWAYVLQSMRTGIPLAVFDGLLIVATLSVVAWLVGTHSAIAVLALTVFAVFIFGCIGLYPGIGQSPEQELRLYTIGLALLLPSIYLSASDVVVSLYLQTTAAICLLQLAVSLPVLRWFVRRKLSLTKWWGLRCVCVIPEENLVAGMAKQAAGARRCGYNILGSFSDYDYFTGRATPDSLLPPLGYLDQLERYMSPNNVSAILHSSPREQDRYFRTLAPHVIMIHPSDHGMSGASRQGLLNSSFNTSKLVLPITRFFKRSLDLLALLVAAPVIIPIMVVLGAVVRWTSKGPAFYRQRRVGREGKVFLAWKFRSMIPDAERVLQEYLDSDSELRAEWERDHKLRDDPRITKIGRLLRKTSLDELPQLLNVLFGEMSLVGPRPIPEYEQDSYRELAGEHGWKSYCSATPGLTGLWQINGRNNTTYEERIGYDLAYQSNWSIWLDFYILLRTIRTVLLREGAY